LFKFTGLKGVAAAGVPDETGGVKLFDEGHQLAQGRKPEIIQDI